MENFNEVHIFNNFDDLIEFIVQLAHDQSSNTLDSEFWRIVENGYYAEGNNTDFSGTD